jgi:hypothetical protein
MIASPVVLVDGDGCLGLFETAEEAAVNLDTTDVVEQEYQAYDGDGRLLVVVWTGETARIDPAEVVPTHSRALRAALERALVRADGEMKEIERHRPLEDLMKEVTRRKRGHWFP